MDVVGGFIILIVVGAITYRLAAAAYAMARRSLASRGHGGAPNVVGAESEAARYADLASVRGQQHADDVERLRADPQFTGAVEELARSETPVDVPLTLARSNRVAVAALGLSALERRTDVPPEWTDRAISTLRRCPPDIEPLIYRVLVKHASHPVIGSALSQIDEGIRWDDLAEFIAARRRQGEELTAETLRRNVARRLAEDIERFVDRYEAELGLGFREAFEEWRRTTVDTEFLGAFARVWERPFDSPPTLLVGRRRELVELILDALEQEPRRSVLLVGEPGVGKTALARAVFDRLPGSFIVFEATAAQVNAGAMYVGELEGRISDLANRLKSQRAVWLLPRLDETLYAGQHARSPQGMLDALLPFIDTSAVTIVGEVTPTALERLLADRPNVAGSFEIIRVRPLDEAESTQVAEHSLEHNGLDVEAGKATLREAYELAQQFLPGLSAPGNLLRLVSAAAAEAAEESRSHFETTDVLAALAASSGLPLAMLDPDEPLALDDVRAFFAGRVLGQPEAVECIVERIAMAKAGVTDPTRPLGVFLFVGPTGTGKTEIAKALAEFMFGSPNRLVRLDMSEFQTPDSLDRLLADASTDPRGANLISAVRKEPFAVVLLDEFEKAAAPVWDLFLQVFDDGRLTDQRGRVADFRRCVIILTSNIGSSIATSRGVGFVPDTDSFRPARVEEAVRRSFRPEFLNRLDRIVVFRPFERAQMRALLEKELAEALGRRGLRGRPWAVELDESAYAFLIERGFSPALGARPLRRALEQYLLTPIATAIVEQRIPAGDQFLLASAPGGRRIEVTFVDPDAEPDAPADAAEAEAGGAPADLRSLALQRRPDGSAADVLIGELVRLGHAIRGDNVQGRKRRGLEAINDPEFWDDDTRFATLADVEYLDRLEAALATAERLGARLSERDARNGRRAGDLASLLAVRLYVLDRAVAGLETGAPQRLFMRLRPWGAGGDEAEGFAATLAEMYRRWADRRGMRIEELSAASGERILAVDGLGCAPILLPEAGLHVLEFPSEGAAEPDSDRVVVNVQVVPWKPGEARAGEEPARRALDGVPASTAIVRRYRTTSAPLVRDDVRGYRTGRLDRVLAGDFDLF